MGACINHVRYPNERIASLRDTLVSLSEHRKQDRRYFSPISTAVQVRIGNQFIVRSAPEIRRVLSRGPKPVLDPGPFRLAVAPGPG